MCLSGFNPIYSTIWYYALVECASSVNFIGCVGALMTGSGLVDKMSCAFRVVDHNVYREELYAYFPCIETTRRNSHPQYRPGNQL